MTMKKIINEIKQNSICGYTILTSIILASHNEENKDIEQAKKHFLENIKLIQELESQLKGIHNDILTLKEFSYIKPYAILCSGKKYISELCSIQEIFWIARKGGIQDWAIYFSISEDIDYTLNYGAKITKEEIIRELVPCDNETFKKYRF